MLDQFHDPCISRSEVLHTIIPHHKGATKPHSFVDADWGGDQSHRLSVTGLMAMRAGGVIAYKTKFQSAVFLSSTEAQFTAAVEAGKIALYPRSKELGFEQHNPMLIYEDNMRALFMVTADQPTTCTRHINTKLFAVLQDWIKEEHISIEALCTQYNLGDQFTKALDIIEFYEQTDAIIGRWIPAYFPLYTRKDSPPYRTTPSNAPKLQKQQLTKPSNTSTYTPVYTVIKELLPTSIFDLIGKCNVGSMGG